MRPTYLTAFESRQAQKTAKREEVLNQIIRLNRRRILEAKAQSILVPAPGCIDRRLNGIEITVRTEPGALN